MPAEEFPQEMAEIWMEQVQTPEIANMLAFNLLQDTDYAPELAFRWLASDKPLYELCAYTLLGRLFQRGMAPNERGINELLDQATVAMSGDNVMVKHAACNCLNKFGELDEEYRQLALKVMEHAHE